MGKTCFICNKIKELCDFYKHKQMSDGHINKCKDCTKKQAIENRNKNIEYYKKYDNLRAPLPKRVKAREEYRKTEAYKISHDKASKKWVLNNPIKRAAQIKVGNSIRDKKLIKKPCEKCGDNKSHAHHSDYKKPLKVKWLCARCHKFKHKVEEMKLEHQTTYK